MTCWIAWTRFGSKRGKFLRSPSASNISCRTEPSKAMGVPRMVVIHETRWISARAEMISVQELRIMSISPPLAGPREADSSACGGR